MERCLPEDEIMNHIIVIDRPIDDNNTINHEYKHHNKENNMKKINTPLKINSKIIKNRITFAPTVKFDWTDTSGIATERFAKHYEDRAEGGTGLIVVEATCVTVLPLHS